MEEERKEDEDAVVVDPHPKPQQRKIHSFSNDSSSPSNSPIPKRSSTRSLDSSSLFESDAHNHHHHHHLNFQHHTLPPHFVIHSRRPSSDTNSAISLDHAMSEFGGAPGTLPEFMGMGGGSSIFRAPLRAAMHPARPPALELRPHPLRETQFGAFLRTIACTGAPQPQQQIWVGTESGMRFWKMSEMFEGGGNGGIGGGGGKVKRGDEESSPFRETVGKMSPTMCMVVDEASRLVWSGHKDGKIRSWKIDYANNINQNKNVDGDGGGGGAAAHFKEGLSWQAHRTPVLSMVTSSYGDMWSSSEGGVIKVWPWESIGKSIVLPAEERHMAAILVERSYIDLRNNYTVNGVCALPPADVKHLMSDHGRSKVWSASSQYFALWDARKRELLKVFGVDGQLDARALEVLQPHDPHAEDEMKTRLVSSSKKEKSQVSFLQRSRNALMGAADAVRRVAVKGTFGEDNRRTEVLAITRDGTIWSGCNNGSLIRWDGNGTRLHDVQHHSHSVKSICTFGTRMWVGYVSGTIQVMDMEGNLLGSWVAHSSPVIKMAVGGSYIFTLGNHGGIRGWSLTSPGHIDNILRSELSNKELLYTKHENVKILCGTWNVGQARASHDSLIAWLGSTASEVGLVVVGLQEVEMGAGFLAMAAAKETVGLEGSANGQWWLDTIGRTLDEGTSFERVGSRQLAGLLICAWARKCIRPHVGDVDAAAVACGFGRAIGNKGSVGLRMRVYDRVICFTNCHFAAHIEAISRRNADFDHIYRTMSFTRPSQGIQPPSGGAASTLNRGGNATVSQSDDGRPDLSEADMVIFLGDFNYRLHSLTYDEARDMVSQRCFDWLREKDQLRAEMKAGKVFQGMREALITFPPTYKFERHVIGLGGYDSSEKKRIPAWCDRILYRDSRSISVAECSLECPVVSSITMYEACMDVTESDHKPVRCIFNVDIAHTDEMIRRKEYGEITLSNEKIKLLLEEHCNVPETTVSTNDIILQNTEASILQLTNKCEKNKAAFEVMCEGQYTIKDDGEASELFVKGSFGFPHWLQVHPAAGVLKPGQTIDVSVHHDEFLTQETFVDGIPTNWWCEDTRDKEVVLSVNVTGSYSTEKKTHLIHVRRCCSPQLPGEIEGILSERFSTNHIHRADFTDFESNSTDLAHDLCQNHG